MSSPLLPVVDGQTSKSKLPSCQQQIYREDSGVNLTVKGRYVHYALINIKWLSGLSP
jgi:hypothetical protein